jgi:hypothetical protein
MVGDMDLLFLPGKHISSLMPHKLTMDTAFPALRHVGMDHHSIHDAGGTQRFESLETISNVLQSFIFFGFLAMGDEIESKWDTVHCKCIWLMECLHRSVP